MVTVLLVLVGTGYATIASTSNSSTYLPAAAPGTQPQLVQTPDANYQIPTQEIDVGIPATAYRYVTATGNYTFLAARPYLMRYTDLYGNLSVKFQAWDVKTPTGFLTLGTSSVNKFPTAYEVNTTVLSGTSVDGYLFVKYNFTVTPISHMKISVSFKNSGGLRSFDIVWLLVGSGYVTATLDSQPVYANSTATLRSAGNVTRGYLGAKPAGNRVWAAIDFSDYGQADLRYGAIVFGGVAIHAAAVIFPPNVTSVDPSLIQTNDGHCASCTSESVAFSSNPASGDLLLGLVHSLYNGACTNAPTATASDTVGSTWSSVSGITIYGGSYCEIQYVFYAAAKSSASDSIKVTFTATMYNMGLIALEVSGTQTTVGNTATGSCTSGCSTSASTSNLTFGSDAFTVAALGGNPNTYCTAGTGFTVLGASLGPQIGCGEYTTSGVSSPTTAPESFGSGGNNDWHELSLEFEAASVVQPITCTMADESAPQATLTLSGDNVSPTSIICDGGQHTFTAGPSGTITITVPGDGSTTRYRLQGGISSTTISTCPSGTCSSASITTYYQYSESVAYALTCATGATCSAPTLSFTLAGSSVQSTLSTSAQAYWVDSDTIVSASASLTDSLGNTYTPSLSSWLANGANVVNSPITYWEGI